MAAAPATADTAGTSGVGSAIERTEADFVEALRLVLPGTPLWPAAPGHRTVLIDEVDTLHGRVDLMLGCLPATQSMPAEAANLYCQPTCCKILASLSVKQPKDIATLCREVGVTRRTCVNWLNQMMEQRLVRRASADRYVLDQPARRHRFRIVSVEAKLRNWQRALYQASRYRAFSDRSFVVMPRRWVGPAIQDVARFRRARIGLASLDGAGVLRVYTSPRNRRPVESPHVWMAAGHVLLQSVG